MRKFERDLKLRRRTHKEDEGREFVMEAGHPGLNMRAENLKEHRWLNFLELKAELWSESTWFGQSLGGIPSEPQTPRSSLRAGLSISGKL